MNKNSGSDILLCDRLFSAQAAVLGSMLIDEDCIGGTLSSVTASMFVGNSQYAHIFQAIRDLYTEGKPIDAVTVRAKLGDDAEWNKTLIGLMDTTPTSANVEAYIEILRKESAVYRMHRIGEKLSEADTVSECAGIVDEALSALRDKDSVDFCDPNSAWKDFMERHGKGKQNFLPWGIRQLDSVLHARLGHYIIIGGYSSDGKTCLALQFARMQGASYRVGYFTLESDKSELVDRIYSSMTGIPIDKIMENSLYMREWEKLTEEAGKTQQLSFEIHNARGYTVQDIASVALSHRLDIVYVDYLQLIEMPGRKYMSEPERISAISRELQVFAYVNNISVVALSQLTPGENKKSRNVADMYDLRGSKQQGMDADKVLILQKVDSADKNSNRRLTIDKNRQGRAGGYCDLIFHGETQRFEALSRQRVDTTPPNSQVPGQRGFAEINETGDEPF